jgi:hypothetical protein
MIIKTVRLLFSISILYSSFVAAELFENEKIAFDKTQQLKIVEIHANSLGSLQSQTIKNISIYAVQEDSLQPIPFQFEEFKHKGFNYPELASEEKDQEGILDHNDLLVFMLKDSGIKASQEQLKDLDVVSIVKLNDADITSYIYVIRNGQVSNKSYVNYDEESGLITMPDATIQINPNNFLEWGDFVYINEGVESESLLDSLKIRINGSFLFFQLKLDNDNLKAKLQTIHHSPVRIVLDGVLQVIVANIPLVDADAQMFIDSSSARLYIDMKTPNNIDKLVKDPVILLGIDGNNLYGTTVRTSVSGESIFEVNGRMDDAEKALNNVKVKESVSWLWLSDGEGFNLIGQYDLRANKNFDPADYPDITIYYLDDENKVDEPERYKGSVPALGYRLEGFPESRRVRMSFKVLIINDVDAIHAKNFLEAFDEPVKVSIVSN